MEPEEYKRLLDEGAYQEARERRASVEQWERILGLGGSYREFAALNRHLPSEITERIVEKGTPRMRAAIAAKRATPDGLLVKLARDEDPVVRWEAAGNPKCPEEALRILENDPVEDIAEHACSQ